MRLRSWRGSTPLSPTPRRPFPWVRTVLVLALLALLGYIFIPNFFYIRADALVQGSLVPVSSIYRVRIDKLLAACADHVTAGQRVAIVSNFLVQSDYQRQYLESEQQSQLSEIALDQSVAEARENAETLHQRYLAASLDEQRVSDTVKSYDRAYGEGAIAKIEWQDKHTELRADSAETASAREAWQRAQQDVSRILQAQNTKLASDRELTDQAQSLATQVGSQPLVAPVSGDVVNCVDRPDNVLQPGTPLFDIYSPERAYVLAYFSPNSVTKIHLGETARIAVAGLSRDVSGHIEAIYPDLSRLPPQLTKFFWQHVQFSEFRPVKILIDRISQSDRAKLYYDAQARVYIDLHQPKRGAGPLVSASQ